MFWNFFPENALGDGPKNSRIRVKGYSPHLKRPWNHKLSWNLKILNSVNFNQPELQRPICRVLLMVPVYSVTSFLSLRFTQFSIYFDTLREWYEAYALYNFMALVLRFLERNYDLRYVLEYKPRQMHIIPFCCLPPFPHGQKFILNCKSGVVQYSFIRTLTTLIALCTQLADKYHEGDFHPQYAYLYIVMINNISQVSWTRPDGSVH